MRVLVDSAIHIDRSVLPAKLLERIRQALSFPNPAHRDRLRLGCSVSGEPEEICLLDESASEVKLPRGAIHILRRLARQDGTEIACEDRRVLPDARLAILPTFPLRDYQGIAITKVEEALDKDQREILVAMATGTGKTKLSIALLYRLLQVHRAKKGDRVVGREG